MRRKCKSCGVDLVFATLENGKTVPLDTKAPVFEVSAEGYKARRANSRFLVSHFATCPSANQHSKTAPKQGATKTSPGASVDMNEARDLLREVDLHGEELTQFEIDFVESLTQQLEAGRSFTLKQVSKLRSIHDERVS